MSFHANLGEGRGVLDFGHLPVSSLFGWDWKYGP